MRKTERRRAPRTSERLALSIKGTGAAGFETETKNISASGAYCSLAEFIAPMTKLQLQLDVPKGAGRTTIRCEGVVVRVEPVITNPDQGRYNIAIFFSELSKRDRSVIEGFVRRRLCASA